MRRLLLFLLLLLLPVPLAAQANPITWTVVPGYNGTFKSGAWIPVTVTIANNGNDLHGRLEWRWQTGSSRFAQTIDLPRGAKKRIVLPVVAESHGGDATLALYDETNAVVRQEQIRFNQVDAGSLVIGVLSDTSNALAEVGGISSGGDPSTSLVRLSQAELPDRGELLQSFDAIFVHNTDTTAWSAGQRTAVTQWVADGGQLIVGGDRVVTASGIGAIRPAVAQEPARPVRLAALAEKTGWKPADPAATVQALQLKPAPEAEVLAADAGRPLLVRRAYGAGQIFQAAFDLQELDAHGDAVPLWEQMIPHAGPPPQWSQLQSNAQWVLQQSIALPALRLPSIWGLLAFLALYIGLVGPANYLILRRLDRREWAYLTVPLTVVLFTLGAYGVGTRGRGSSATTTALTLVHAAPASTTGQALSFLGVYSPSRRSYRVGLAQDALVWDGLNTLGTGRQALEIVRTESAVEMPSFFVDVGAMRTLNVEQTVPVPEVRALLRQADDGQWTIGIENRSAEALVDVALIAGQNLQKLDDLGPGERRTVAFKPEFGGPLDDSSFHNEGVIKRGTALRALQNFAVEPGMPPQQGPNAPAQPVGDQEVRLAAWSSRPGLQVTLNGAPDSVQGDTLYLWALGKLSP